VALPHTVTTSSAGKTTLSNWRWTRAAISTRIVPQQAFTPRRPINTMHAQSHNKHQRQLTDVSGPQNSNRMTTNKHDSRDQGTSHRRHGHQGISHPRSHFPISLSLPPPNHRSDPRLGLPEPGRKFARRKTQHTTQTNFILCELPLSGPRRTDDNFRRFFLDIRYAVAAHPLLVIVPSLYVF
jgi:hypothetical protein